MSEEAKLEARVQALLKQGRHADAAALLARFRQTARAAELYAAVWRFDEAIALTEHAGRLDEAYRHALASGERGEIGRLLEALLERPELAPAAAEHALAKGRSLDAARLLDAAGELAEAAPLYERGGELGEAARCREQIGAYREAGVLYEKRLREEPEDREAALALGRILIRFGRWDHAVRALQKAAQAPEHLAVAGRLLIASFAAMGMEEAASRWLDTLRREDPSLPVSVPDLLEATYGDPRGLAGLVGKEGEQTLLAGRYRILGPLGTGATGRVLRAHDAFYEREVAVKVLHSAGNAGRDAFVRFAKEARITSGIQHPNVVQVFEFNSDGPYLVMELMEGGTLEDRLKSHEGRPLLPEVTRHVALSILAALEVVHRRGVIHRDLKPANVFFGHAGEVKLGDFGVAHLTDLGATMTGALMGTLAFMAPEQITGASRPDATTDFYAFGVILYRCLVGRLPFEGPDFVQQHLHQEVPRPSLTAPWLGPKADALLLSLLAKEQEARPKNISAILGGLNALDWVVMTREIGSHRGAPVQARPAETPELEESDAERYRVLRDLGGGARIARDTLLDREVRLVMAEGPQLTGLRALAAADGPHLQAIYAIDEEAGLLVLEEPGGEPWSKLRAKVRGEAGPIRAEIRSALQRIHERGLIHGELDADKVRVSADRAVLLLPRAPREGDPAEDEAALRDIFS